MADANPADGKWPPLRMSGIEVDVDSDNDMDGKPPVHPVSTMQGAFEESMAETLNEANDQAPPDRYSTADSVSRRKMLLEQAEYERTVAGRWKQKPGEKFHPLWKLVAQISFGMHLLQQGLAKSDEEVIKILQTHVDDVDGFLERTTEDFDLAQGDINERIRYLRLPLEHGDVFDGMLNDRSFRIAIVEGNEKIEHIIDRTAAAMTDALKDVQKGLDATRELAKYLTRVDKRWDDRTEEHDSVYLAMIGNTEGWTRAFLTLQSKGNTLRKALIQLGGIVAEMQKRAGAASRKNLVPARAISGRYQVEALAPTSRHSINPPKSPQKPLPKAPEAILRPTKARRSSHQSGETSSNGSKRQGSKNKVPSSPYLEQAIAAKRVEPVMRVTSSELGASKRSPKSSASGDASEAAPPTKVTNSAPPTPSSPSSRRGSFSERTRSITRKFSFFKDSTDAKHSKSDMAIQGPQIHEPTMDASLSSPPQRVSLRKTDAASVSAYSASPTSPKKVTESPIVREASPQHISRSGEVVLTQSSYGTMNFLPAQPAISPLTDKSFTFGEEAWSQTHSRASSHQYMTPAISRQEAEHKNGPSHPLSNEVYQNLDVAKPSHRLPGITQDVIGDSTGTPSGLAGAYQSTEWNTNKSLGDWKPVENGRNNDDDFHQPLDTPKADPERAGTSTVSLPVGPQANFQVFQGPISPALTELEAPLPPSHPLLLDAQLPKPSASKTAPPTPPRNPARDLPLRHYRSQEQFTASGGSLRKDEEVVIPKRSNSQRASTQVSADIKTLLSESPLATALSPAPTQSSATPSPLRLLIDPSNTASVANTATQTSNSAISSAPVVESPPNSNGRSDLASGLRSGPPVTDAIVPNNIINPSKSNNEETLGIPPKQHSPSSSSPALSSNAQYKTSATHNTPFFLNPDSSAALIEFLATTPPSTPPGHKTESQSGKLGDVPATSQERSNPGKVSDVAATSQESSNPGKFGDVAATRQENSNPGNVSGVAATSQESSNAGKFSDVTATSRESNTPGDFNDAPATSQQSSNPGKDIEPATSAPPAPGLRGKTPIFKLGRSREEPPSNPPVASAEKTPKWKKMFGARGAARQKSAKAPPEVVIVGKGEWYKIDRKKKQKSQSSTSGEGQGPDVNGSAGPAGDRRTGTVEAGFMGVGKDGVWISGKNFLKT